MDDWHVISNVDRIDLPTLAFYPNRISDNIELAKRVINDTNRFHPYVKTNKTAEVSRMLLDVGIRRFKCATIAEAGILGYMNTPDVLLAYQPVGLEIPRLLDSIKTYPVTRYSCLAGQAENAHAIPALCEAGNITLDIFIDLSVGMNCIGVLPGRAEALVDAILLLKSPQIIGLHGYDGYVHDTELSVRYRDTGTAYTLTEHVFREISHKLAYPLVRVMGGTPTFSVYTKWKDCECSPGTFVLQDWGCGNAYPDMSFKIAALLMTRVISVLDEYHICVDPDYKAVTSESSLSHVFFLNHPEAKPISQSEEHLVLEVPDSQSYPLGSVLCDTLVRTYPTVALYDKIYVVRDREAVGGWPIIAHLRRIIY